MQCARMQPEPLCFFARSNDSKQASNMNWIPFAWCGLRILTMSLCTFSNSVLLFSSKSSTTRSTDASNGSSSSNIWLYCKKSKFVFVQIEVDSWDSSTICLAGNVLPFSGVQQCELSSPFQLLLLLLLFRITQICQSPTTLKLIESRIQSMYPQLPFVSSSSWACHHHHRYFSWVTHALTLLYHLRFHCCYLWCVLCGDAFC